MSGKARKEIADGQIDGLYRWLLRHIDIGPSHFRIESAPANHRGTLKTDYSGPNFADFIHRLSALFLALFVLFFPHRPFAYPKKSSPK